MNSTLHIPFVTIKETLEKILLQFGFTSDRAALCAQLFAQSSLDGVPSHGLNRFSGFLNYIQKGYVVPDAAPALMGSFGVLERWNGHLGPGNLNAHHAMSRAISLAKDNGVGAVALQNTNHWMRAGNYGWQAVDAGCIGICFTNTKPNMPAWGGSEPKLGNNPLVIAIPRKEGPVVLDMAMSQFAYGKMQIYERAGKNLPFDGGFDQKGNLSRSPKEILEHEMALPIGLWKGAGLSLMLDMLVVLLSGGQATHQIEEEYSISQAFLCFDPKKLGMESWMEGKADQIIGDLKSSKSFGQEEVKYPGENTLRTRKENLEKGVPVDEAIWLEILSKS